MNGNRCYLRGTSALGLFNTVVGCLFNRVLVVAVDSDTHKVVRWYWDLAEVHPPDGDDDIEVPPKLERGCVIVPSLAYLDGRDLDAKQPVTVMRINLWDSVPRKFAVGTVRHGQRVRVIEKQWSEDDGEYFYLVRRWFKLGWVAAPFLNLFRTEPIGDRI